MTQAPNGAFLQPEAKTVGCMTRLFGLRRSVGPRNCFGAYAGRKAARAAVHKENRKAGEGT